MCTMLLATIALCAIFCVHNIHSFDDSTGNIHVMKSEIEKAMEDCGETNSSAENTKAEFQKKSSILLLVQNNPKHETTHNQRNGEDGEMNLTRRRRNINLLAELASRFLQEKLDDNSGDWDYGGGVGTEDSNNDSNNNRGKNQRNNGQSWDDPKDDMSVMDSIYSHNRRNNSNSYSRGNDNSQSGRGNSLQDQNSTRINPNTMGNNFDSRGARFHSAAGFRKLMDDRVYRSVKDLNKTSNFYDPFMTRGIRSVGKNTIRKKRYDRLTKIANENEVGFSYHITSYHLNNYMTCLLINLYT